MVLDNPHIFLDEIMRQAYDSEIIRFSMWIREGKPINQFPVNNQQVKFVKKEELNVGMYEWADQIICATNEKRNAVNNNMRKIKGFGPRPELGDKIISLHNHWDFMSRGKNPFSLTNGTIGTITTMQNKTIQFPFWITTKPISVLYTSIIDEEGNKFDYIPIDYSALTTGEKALTEKQEYLIRGNNKCADPPFEFAYAYGITCHKAQGSEWGKVLVIEERFPFDKEEHARWAYTAATRASDKLVWVLP